MHKKHERTIALDENGRVHSFTSIPLSDQKVLGVLLDIEEEEIGLAELQSQTNLPWPTLHSSLLCLTTLGLIEVRGKGKRRRARLAGKKKE